MPKGCTPLTAAKIAAGRIGISVDETRSFITPAQFDALCAVATDAEACMMRFAYGTGMRGSWPALATLMECAQGVPLAR